jgi:hypothetical protein
MSRGFLFFYKFFLLVPFLSSVSKFRFSCESSVSLVKVPFLL